MTMSISGPHVTNGELARQIIARARSIRENDTPAGKAATRFLRRCHAHRVQHSWVHHEGKINPIEIVFRDRYITVETDGSCHQRYTAFKPTALSFERRDPHADAGYARWFFIALKSAAAARRKGNYDLAHLQLRDARRFRQMEVEVKASVLEDEIERLRQKLPFAGYFRTQILAKMNTLAFEIDALRGRPRLAAE
jgi:hypothetical protein